MELFFPFIGVATLGIAAVAAACYTLSPRPKHLVSRVFIGTFTFLVGGSVFTFMVFVALALNARTVASNIHLREVSGMLICGFIFLLKGAISAWVSVRLLNGLIRIARLQTEG